MFVGSKVGSVWANGVWAITDKWYLSLFASIWSLLGRLSTTGGIQLQPLERHLDFCDHIYREQSLAADALANKERQSGSRLQQHAGFGTRYARCFYNQSDGSYKGSKGGAGAILFRGTAPAIQTDNPKADMLGWIGVQISATDALQTKTVAFWLALLLCTAHVRHASFQLDLNRYNCSKDMASHVMEQTWALV